MKKFKGFSLAEMMVVMLLITVILAATAPMITKRVSRERTDSLFAKLRTNPNNAVEYVGGRGQRIFMEARNNGRVGIVENGVDIPGNSILFGYNTLTGDIPSNLVGIGFGTSNGDSSVAIGRGANANSRSVAVGYNAITSENNGVSIGYRASSTEAASIAIGSGATVQRQRSDTTSRQAIAIGAGAVANSQRSVAIGYNAQTSRKLETGAIMDNQVAIGSGAVAKHDKSVAIGYNAKTEYANTIVLGNEDTTVFIPGNLVVNHSALIGFNGGNTDNLYVKPYAGRDGTFWATPASEDWKDDGWAMVRDKSTNQYKVTVGPFATSPLTKQDSGADLGDNARVYVDIMTPSNSTKKYKVNDLSDIRLKDVGDDYTAGLEELLNLKFYHYTFKADEKKIPHVGVMAQDLQKVFPDAVNADEDGWLHIRWDEMFYAAINAIKQLNEKIVAVVADVTGIKELAQTNQKTIEAQAELITKQAEQIDLLTKRVEALELKLNEVKE